jgi:hypothetical protein
MESLSFLRPTPELLAEQALATLQTIEANLAHQHGLGMAAVSGQPFRWMATKFLSEAPQLSADPAEWWRTRIDEAHAFAEHRQHQPNANVELWMVTAQHPLKEGEKPGDEFAARLDEMVSRYEQAEKEGRRINIYVSGNRHVDDTSQKKHKPADTVALSDAARNYLIQRGVPANSIYGEEWNLIKGRHGVYNGGDEIAVAAQVFRTRPRFSSVHIILSPGQQQRATLYAVANGILPEFVVPDGLREQPNLHHSDTAESTPLTVATYFIDPTWQSRRSPFGYLSRRRRVPKDGSGLGSIAIK